MSYFSSHEFGKRRPGHCCAISKTAAGRAALLRTLAPDCPGFILGHHFINQNVNQALLVIFLGSLLWVATSHYPVSGWVGALGLSAELLAAHRTCPRLSPLSFRQTSRVPVCPLPSPCQRTRVIPCFLLLVNRRQPPAVTSSELFAFCH